MSSCPARIFEDSEMHKFARNEPYEAAMWMLRKQVGDLADKIKLKVYIRKMSKQRGVCWSYKNHPNEFTIVIDSDMGRNRSLRTIAHETVHVAQYLTGKIKDIWDDRSARKVMWKDKIFDSADSGAAYFNSPWEKEAYAQQDRIADAYRRHLRKKST